MALGTDKELVNSDEFEFIANADQLYNKGEKWLKDIVDELKETEGWHQIV